MTDSRPGPARARPAGPWHVLVPKSNGSRVLFGAYAHPGEARAVAAALRAVGRDAEVSQNPTGARLL